jgi:acyl-[acyl-carrier-protein]-phospholipid O-acyltransferase/long-chain-fatty-acid--[acyl-carrier-protein] ligase
LSITNTIIIQGILACSGMGIILGSVIAGRISKTHIETALIPVGSIGITFCLLILPALGNVYLQAVLFLGWGIFGGFLLIPLNSLIQFHAEKNELGRIVASSNLIQNTVMLTFLGLTVLFAFYGMNSLTLFNILFVVATVGTFYTVYKLRQSLVRFIASHISDHR